MIYTKTFDCGIKFAFKRTKSPVSYSALTVKSGTRNEPEQFGGIAHMTEHMLFKGTAKRTPQQICNRLEKLGGDLNAYTNKEETVLYATVLREDTPKAVDLLLELAFTSTFPQDELEKERNVVIDEINMYKDSPSECIFDDFERFLFGGHELSNPILGTAASLKKIKSEDIARYVRENFIPANMCLSIVGSMTQQRAEKIAADAISKYVREAGGQTRCYPPLEGGSLASGTRFEKNVCKKNHQVNCIMGASAYSFYDSDRLAMILLSNILGGPSSNSRLNQSLREKSALVYNVETVYTQYSDSGAFLIYFGCEKENLEECLSLIDKELDSVRENALSDREMKDAKRQLLGQLAISSDSGESQALSMGKSMLFFNRIMPDDEIRAKINAIDAEQLQRVAREVLCRERLSTLVYR